MNQSLVNRIVQTVLYEGYILYPYRRSVKNHSRWTFGSIFPSDYVRAVGGVEPHAIQTQCLLRGDEHTKLSVNVCFLQLVDRTVATASLQTVDQIEVAGKRYQSWQEAIERPVCLETGLTDAARQLSFEFPDDESIEHVHDSAGRVAAMLLRKRSRLEGLIEVTASRQRDDVFQLTARVINDSPLVQPPSAMSREQALMQSMASTHVVLHAFGGEFVSLIDPPAELKGLAGQCKNIGVWPVLVGEAPQADGMLASPIILYDYPQVAPQSPGDLFDGTEIDEILSLRILTLSDHEKQAAADLDERSAALLRRTESLAREQLMRLHGTMRGSTQLAEVSPRKIDVVHVGDAELRIGQHVRLNPSGRADAFDVILRGKTATITGIEQDYENRIHLAVTIDDDPGADIGAAGKIGHRFYFRPEEVEPIAAKVEAYGGWESERVGEGGTKHDSRILVAGIGNIFLGDDAFGAYVAQRLMQRALPANVRVVDFGIRGLDLAYALMDGCDLAILIDAVPRGQPPGTLSVLEPQRPEPSDHADPELIQAHSMDPQTVLRLVASMQGQVGRVLLVGCEPSPLDPEQMQMELSPPVQAAIEPAVQMVESLIAQFCATPSITEIQHAHQNIGLSA